MKPLPPRELRAPYVDFKHRPAPRDDRPLWLPGIAAVIVLLLLGGWLDGRVETERTASLTTSLIAAHRDSVSLTPCPPPAPGYTDTVVLVVESRADSDPVVTGCSRITERTYATRHRPW